MLDIRACYQDGWPKVGGNTGIGLWFGWPEMVMVAGEGGGLAGGGVLAMEMS